MPDEVAERGRIVTFKRHLDWYMNIKALEGYRPNGTILDGDSWSAELG